MGDKDVGFVGLGIMGRPMAKNLINAGYSLTVYDVVGTAVEELATEGAAVGSSSREVAEKTSTVITMVPDSADSEAAILGPDGVLEGASGSSPDLCVKAEEAPRLRLGCLGDLLFLEE